MNKESVLSKLDAINELPNGTLNGSESTSDWSSIVLISVIALADEEYNKSIRVSQLTQTATVNEVVDLLLN